MSAREIVWSVTREYADELAGVTLTDAQIARFAEAIWYSSVPQALGEILSAIMSQESNPS